MIEDRQKPGLLMFGHLGPEIRECRSKVPAGAEMGNVVPAKPELALAGGATETGFKPGLESLGWLLLVERAPARRSSFRFRLLPEKGRRRRRTRRHLRETHHRLLVRMLNEYFTAAPMFWPDS